MTAAATQKPAIPILKAIDGATAAIVFAAGGVEAIIQKIDAEVRPATTDLATKAGRDAITSAAYKVTRATTILDDIGKDSVADLKKRASAVDVQRRVLREGLTTLRDQIRAPLTDWENAETQRVAGHDEALATLAAMLAHVGDRTPAEIEAQLLELGEIAQRDWQEYEARAVTTIDHVRSGLRKELAAAVQREADAAELARLREAQAERDRQDRDARIAQEAADHARAQAEATAARQHEAIDQERRDAIARAEQAEADKVAAAERAEAARIATAAKAERDRQAAIEAERQRVAADAARVAAETAKREANKRHAAKINNEVLAALVERGVDPAVAKIVIASIVRGEIPHTKISY